MKYKIKLHDGKEQIFEGVVRVVDTQRDNITIYGENDIILAVINRGDLSLLLQIEN